jgi:uncharacterized integral membrane protein
MPTAATSLHEYSVLITTLNTLLLLLLLLLLLFAVRNCLQAHEGQLCTRY